MGNQIVRVLVGAPFVVVMLGCIHLLHIAPRHLTTAAAILVSCWLMGTFVQAVYKDSREDSPSE